MKKKLNLLINVKKYEIGTLFYADEILLSLQAFIITVRNYNKPNDNKISHYNKFIRTETSQC